MLPNFLTKPDPDIYKYGSYLVLDFETTNKDKGDAYNEENDIVLAYWIIMDRDRNSKYRYCFGNHIEQTQLVEDINSVDFIVCHNSKFELQWLKRIGVDLRKILHFDTMIAEYVIGGNKKRGLKLDQCAKRYGIRGKTTLVSRMIEMGICPSTIPKPLLKKYCRRDVVITHDLMLEQLQWIEDNHPPLLNVLYTRCLLTPALADIESNGLTLDPAEVEEVRNEYMEKLAEVDRQLYEINPDLNWNSPQQKAEYLYDEIGFKEPTDHRGEVLKTPSGGRKTDSDTIEGFTCKTEVQRLVVGLIKQRNKYASALSKSLDFFYGVCQDYEGRFRGSFNQCVTSTHRLSSSGKRLAFPSLGGKKASAQFQNLPREFKRLLRASSEDRVIGEGDGSQLEFRVAGHLGRDEQIYYDITHDVDIHQFTADEITRAGEQTSRQDAKANTFKPLYGGRSGTPAQQAYYEAFKQKYSSLSEIQEGWAKHVAAHKDLTTEWGMKYYFPFVKVEKSGYIKGSTQIYNFPIQAFATAEIIPIALVFFWHRIAGYDINIINTVHDSIICDMAETEVTNFSQLITISMIDDVYEYLKTVYSVEFSVPLGVGIKIGSHWSKADTSLAQPISLGIEAAGYEAINDKDKDEEFKAEAHKKVLDKLC